MPTVSNTVTRPGGGAWEACRVRIRLYSATDGTLEAAYDVAADRTVVGELYLLTDDTGLWSTTLQANSTITPANTVYEVTEAIGDKAAVSYYVSVPNGAGPYWTGDILTTAPARLEVPAPAVRRRVLRFDRYYAAGFVSIPATTSGNSSAVITVPIDPDATPSAYAHLTDPEGWWSPTYTIDGADPTNTTTGVTIPAGTAVLLPPGVYYADVFILVTPALDVTTQWANCYIDQTEYDPNHDYTAQRYPTNAAASVPWIYDGYNNPLSMGAITGTPIPFFTPNQPARYNGAAWRSGAMLINDSPDARPFALYANQRSVAAPTGIQFVSVQIVRVSGEGW